MGGKGKLFWKDGVKVNGRKMENFSRIKDGNWWLEVGEDERIERIILRM